MREPCDEWTAHWGLQTGTKTPSLQNNRINTSWASCNPVTSRLHLDLALASNSQLQLQGDETFSWRNYRGTSPCLLLQNLHFEINTSSKLLLFMRFCFSISHILTLLVTFNPASLKTSGAERLGWPQRCCRSPEQMYSSVSILKQMTFTLFSISSGVNFRGTGCVSVRYLG